MVNMDPFKQPTSSKHPAVFQGLDERTQMCTVDVVHCNVL